MKQETKQDICAAVRKGIDKALEPFYENDSEGVFGENTVALAAEAATAVIIANFDGQETAVAMGTLKAA